MSAFAKTKKQAAQLEHDRQYDKALALYARLLDDAGGDEEIDVGLYNRAGDLALRVGETTRAVAYFERALDLYAAGGFLNNAIALGVKIVRHAPGHLAAHYTLGVLYGKKGFRSDARRHLLEYADRMHRGGRDDEARRALGDYVALCAGADEAHEELDRHLAAAPAKAPEGAVSLRVLLDSVAPRRAARDDGADLRHEPAPDAAAAAGPPRAPGMSSLVFLDVGFADAEPAPATPSGVALAPGFQPTSTGADAPERPAPQALTLTGELPPLTVAMLDRVARPVVDSPAADAPDGPGAPTMDHGLVLLDVSTPWQPETTHHADDLVIDLVAAPADVAPPPARGDETLDLGDWLRSTEEPVTTRMTSAVAPQSGDEDADFAESLRAFKAGVARSVDEADHEAHYDLGVAYREMGLLDEAVGEFQKAARMSDQPRRPLEALGHCFLDRGQPELTLAALDGIARELAQGPATAASADDARNVGLCYLLGAASEATGRTADARGWYLRVLATDYQFRDAAARLASLPPLAT